MTFGIDKLGVYVPKTYLDLRTLAQARGVDPDKYLLGIGQKKMAIPMDNEDVVTMALEAAHQILNDDDRQTIDTILFTTESGVDFSKAAGIYAHAWLGLAPAVRVLELKQACYASTGALRMALEHVQAQPDKKVLILSSDVAWYGFESGGEVTQGAGAIAILVSQNPRIAEVHEGTVRVENQLDFYRPSYSKVPIVDGKLSIKCYQDILSATQDHQPYLYTCFHMPFASMAKKANSVLSHPMDETHLECVKGYGQDVGNIYNGSLYLSLLSVIDQAPEDLTHQKLGMFAYGSGAIGEFFTLTIQASYKQGYNQAAVRALFEHRKSLTMDQYEAAMNGFEAREAASHHVVDPQLHRADQTFVLERIDEGHRSYAKIQ
jgi:hydroxymethylglutaryl-CoA synthase